MLNPFSLFNFLHPKLLLILCSLVGGTLTIKGQQTSAFAFLKLPTSSHVNALGGLNVSILDDDLSLTTLNPALLGPEMSNQLALQYMRYLPGINWGSAQYAHSFTSRGAWAVGATYLDYGTLNYTGEHNEQLGSFSAQDLALDVTLGYDITSQLRGGVKAKFLYASYEQYNSIAIAVDLGLNYLHPNSGASFSLVLKNLGAQLMRFDDSYEHLPLDVQLGFSQSLAHAPFRFSITAYQLFDWSSPLNLAVGEEEESKKSNFATQFFRHLIFGVEYLATDNLYFAVGYNHQRRIDFGQAGGFLPGFSAGAGLQVHRFNLHASYASYHQSGATLMFGLNILFDKF